MLEAFPEKPKGMHWRTYERQRRLHDGLMGFVKRLGRRTSRRADDQRADAAIEKVALEAGLNREQTQSP